MLTVSGSGAAATALTMRMWIEVGCRLHLGFSDLTFFTCAYLPNAGGLQSTLRARVGQT